MQLLSAFIDCYLLNNVYIIIETDKYIDNSVD